MQLKDIEANKRYATVWLYKPGDGRFARVDSLDRRDFQDLMSRIQCVEVLEVGVRDSIRTRPGVLVKRINASTGEDSDDDPITMACARIIAPWDELVAAYEDRVEQEEEREAERIRQIDLERARRQEADAKRWMEDSFAEARAELERSIKVLVQAGALAGEWQVGDEMIRMQHELIYPEGNPYLNGERD